MNIGRLLAVVPFFFTISASLVIEFGDSNNRMDFYQDNSDDYPEQERIPCNH